MAALFLYTLIFDDIWSFCVQYISSQESPLECIDGFYRFDFCFWSYFFVIVDDFQLVSSCNRENLSKPYVFTRIQYASKIITQCSFVVGSVYNVLFCFAIVYIKISGFQYFCSIMLEVLHGAGITDCLANVIRILHVNINLIFLGNEAVVMFGDMVRNA